MNAAGPWAGRIAAMAGIRIPLQPGPGVMLSMQGRLTWSAEKPAGRSPAVPRKRFCFPIGRIGGPHENSKNRFHANGAGQMTSRTVEFSILRYKPGHIDPPRFQDFRLDVEEGVTVLDALERICLTRDGSLMYRYSCHRSSCGTCACLVNGDERLACTTRVLDLGFDKTAQFGYE